VGEVLYDFPSPNYGVPENGLQYTRDLIGRWAGHERIGIAVEPHAPYTCSPDLLRQCHALAEEADVPFIIHLAETTHEIETVRERYGTTPVAHLHDLGILDDRLIADHVVHPTDADLDLIVETGAAVVHNPESNMKLASGAAPVAAMVERDICVALGTDGCASNNNLDMFQEMDAAAKLQKVVTGNPTALPAHTVVAMATREGARALGLADTCGRIEPGLAADLIVVDLQQPHLTPLYDVDSHLVYAARGADVLSTMVAGRWLMKDRQFTTLDPVEVMGAVNRIAGEIRALV
jgi:5-methylthioadenosine/S-adenosylhomocysteine deaminase